METIVVAGICFVVVQQVIFFYFIHLLQNKLMSRNYGEYVTSERELKRTEVPRPKVVEHDQEYTQDDFARV